MNNMTEEVKKFLSRLKTVKDMACDLRVTPKTIYDRIKKGDYECIEISGIKLIVEPEKDK